MAREERFELSPARSSLPPEGVQLPALVAAAITDATFEKIVLMLVATPGMIAPAATATKPAIKAYDAVIRDACDSRR